MKKKLRFWVKNRHQLIPMLNMPKTSNKKIFTQLYYLVFAKVSETIVCLLVGWSRCPMSGMI